MSYIQFESARDKESQREAIKKAREKILIEAEDKYRKKEALKDQAKLRGDDKWMLPSVEAKLVKDKSNKSKKKDKEKRKKKSKKKRRKSSSSSSRSDTSDNEEMQWIEKTSDVIKKSSSSTSATESEKPLQRDEWMNLSGSFLCSSRDKKSNKAENKKQETCILDKPGQSSVELNPYWKNNGSGMPEKENIVKKSSTQIMSAEWLKKSLRRAEEQALEEGRSLEDIAAERWGSLDIIKSQIDEAEKQSRHGSYSRRNYGDDRSADARKSYHTRYNRDRSRSRSRSRGHSSRNYDDYKSDFRNKKKLTFKKPDEENYISSSYSSRQSSSSTKNWRKSEANEKIAQQQVQSQTSKSQNTEGDSMSENEPSESEEIITPVSIKILTDDELNKLGARIVKAEIIGDIALAAELKIKLENARETRKNNPKPIEEKREVENNVILTMTNSCGLARPVQARSRYQEPQGGRRRNKKTETHEAGERVRYFADDDKFSLQDMFQREKGESTNNDDAMFVKMASKSMDMDELFEERITHGESDTKQDHRDKMRAIKEHQKMQKSLDNCRWCVDSNEMQKHLIVAMGAKVYLSLPWHVSLTPGHCIIAPIHHVSCQTQLDEDIWEEITLFKKALTKMFMDNNECPIFFEIATGQYRFPHMQLECVSLPEEVGSIAPMYFKKALLECETEWSTNKKIVDLSQKDVRQAIPKGLPYFVVNFGNHGGFAHVIEDEKMFPKNFAQEIIGGMLDLNSSMWRKPRRENFDRQKQKVLLFADKWKKYDVTSNITD